MICNMVTKPTGAPRGRPQLPLRADHEGHLLAYYQAQCLLYGRGSARAIALSLAMVRFGEMVNNPENLENFSRGCPVDFVYLGATRGTEGSKEPRDKSAFHPRVDDWSRKARRFSNESLATDDGRWFTCMTHAWVAVLGRHHV